jgi:hypothetical protein
LLAHISTLKRNTTLKTLGFDYHSFVVHLFPDDEVKQLVSVEKNYGLERLMPYISVFGSSSNQRHLRLDWRDVGIL